MKSWLPWLSRKGSVAGLISLGEIGTIPILGDRHAESARFRCLILTDSLGPTLQINFLRPLAADRQSGNCGLWVVNEANEIEHVGRPELIRLLTRFRPHLILASRYGGILVDVLLEGLGLWGIPIVAHLDDDLLFGAEGGQEMAAKHMAEARRDRLRRLIEGADLTYLSTDLLRKALVAKGVRLPSLYLAEICGAIEVLRPASRSEKTAASATFGYFGSRSHNADLEMVGPAIAHVLDGNRALKFELYGSVEAPPALRGRVAAHHEKTKDYDSFLAKLATLNWDFGLAPLKTNAFTLCKTNIKWIEYAAAGIPVLASDHPIYRDCCSDGAGRLVADTDWERAIGEMAADQTLRIQIATSAQRKLATEYSPERLRGQVWEMFRAARAATP